MDYKRENATAKAKKLSSLNQSIISSLIHQTYESIDYNCQFYILPKRNPNLCTISFPYYFQIEDDFTETEDKVTVHVDMLANHLPLFSCVLKALADFEMPCSEYLTAAEAFQDGLLFDSDHSHYLNCLKKAAKRDVLQCIKWLINNQKKDSDTFGCLLLEVENYVRNGHSLANLDVPHENILALGLDCVEPAARGNAEALYRLAFLYHNCGCDMRADEILTDLVKMGEPLGYTGMSNLLYREGKTFSQQIDDIQYHTKAADCGNIEAMYRSGAILTKTLKSDKDYHSNWFKGFHYLQRAADNNHTNACFLLGRIYYQGVNIPKDLDKAEKYLTIAANQGHREAATLLRIIKKIKINFLTDIFPLENFRPL